MNSKDKTHTEKFQPHQIIIVINNADVIFKFIHNYASNLKILNK